MYQQHVLEHFNINTSGDTRFSLDCAALTLQYVRDQQGGAVVITGQTAVGQVLLYL